MPSASGSGATVFQLAGEPVAFAGEPLLADGGGWWRIASRLRRFWPDASVEVEVDSGDGWTPARPLQVERLGGRVKLACAAERARAAGLFLPASGVAEASGWQLASELACRATSTLGDGYASRTSALVAADIVLSGVAWMRIPPSGAPLVVELHSGRLSYLAATTAPARPGTDMRIRVDADDLVLPTA